jgi:3-mercaptopyruvate sulfurtransferase SseA
MRFLLFLVLGLSSLYAGQFDTVKITPTLSYAHVYHKGKAIKIHRIQDTEHKLTGEYAKLYRPLKYIQPLSMNKAIETIAELELLTFMQEKGNSKKGLVIDVREKSAYQEESIPSAVNIPFAITENPMKMKKVLKVLGAKLSADGSWDMSNVMDIAVYSNGLWCESSANFINAFLNLGYPTNKILYYRGGMQMWKILGFTTVINK